MLVTVVVPAYQASTFIAEALLSVAEQDHRPLELIVVDDCSTDDTSTVVERLRPRLEDEGLVVRVIRLPENLGATAALERGFAEAEGEMICWLSADDAFVERDKTSRQLRAMESGAAVSYSSGFLGGMTPAESIRVDANWVHRVPWADRLFDRNPTWRLVGLLFMNPINGTSVMLRRTALSSMGTFDSTLSNIDGDGDLWLRYSALGARFASITGATVFYREHDGQTSKRVAEMDAGCVHTRIRIVLALRESGRLGALLRRAWPVLVPVVRGGYAHWPAVGQYLCESSRDVHRGLLAGLLLRRLETKLKRAGVWIDDHQLEGDARSGSASEEFARFRIRLKPATARQR